MAIGITLHPQLHTASTPTVAAKSPASSFPAVVVAAAAAAMAAEVAVTAVAGNHRVSAYIASDCCYYCYGDNGDDVIDYPIVDS